MNKSTVIADSTYLKHHFFVQVITWTTTTAAATKAAKKIIERIMNTKTDEEYVYLTLGAATFQHCIS